MLISQRPLAELRDEEAVMIDQPVLETMNARPDRTLAWRVSYGLLWLLDHWVLVFLGFFGVFLFLPFLAPIFMHIGWTGPAQLIYIMYSTLCHEMAQRSSFLYGPQPMYRVSQLPIQITRDEVVNMLALRAFVGNADLGWKVAWSDRMVYMYSAMWLTAIVFGVRRHRRHIRPLRLPVFMLLLLPMGI